MDKGFTPKQGRLMDMVRETIRFHQYAYSTEKSYIMKYVPRFCLLIHSTSCIHAVEYFTLRASLQLFKFIPDKFVNGYSVISVSMTNVV